MSARFGLIGKAVLRPRNATCPRSHAWPGPFLRSGVRVASKGSRRVPISIGCLVNASSHPQNSDGNIQDKDVRQGDVWTKDPSEDSPIASASDMAHVNTKDILTVDWRRFWLQEAVQNTQHQIQRCEDEITISERRITDLSSWESKADSENNIDNGGIINMDSEADSYRKEESGLGSDGKLDGEPRSDKGECGSGRGVIPGLTSTRIVSNLNRRISPTSLA
jgi:hypothetical protein